jgi:hypothetical protein
MAAEQAAIATRTAISIPPGKLQTSDSPVANSATAPAKKPSPMPQVLVGDCSGYRYKLADLAERRRTLTGTAPDRDTATPSAAARDEGVGARGDLANAIQRAPNSIWYGQKGRARYRRNLVVVGHEDGAGGRQDLLYDQPGRQRRCERVDNESRRGRLGREQGGVFEVVVDL